MAVTRASVDTVRLLSSRSDLAERFKACLKLHNFTKKPFIDEFAHQDHVMELSHPIYQRREVDGRVFYFIVEKKPTSFDGFPYPAYKLHAVFRIINKFPTVWLSSKNQYIMPTEKVSLNKLTRAQNSFLYKICEHVIHVDGDDAYLSKQHQVKYSVEQNDIHIFLNLSQPMIATRTNKEPIGRESSYRWRGLGMVLGEGGYGSVYDATLKFTPNTDAQFDLSTSPVVFKIMPNGNKRKNAMLSYEYRMLKELGVKPKPLACYQDQKIGDVSVLGMRKYDGQEFFDLAEKELSGLSYLKAEQRLYIAIHCAQRMAAIHRRGILHNDIKDSNVLVSENWDVDVIDFGLAAPVGYQRLGVYGTPGYIAPEVLANHFYSYKSDIFSYGCLFRELFNITALQPFDVEINALEDRIHRIDGDDEDLIDTLHDKILKYREQQSRVTSTENFLHPAIKDIPLEQEKKLKFLYTRMHYVSPKFRPSINDIIEKLNGILLEILISSYPEKKHQYQAIFKSADYFKGKVDAVINEAVNLEGITKLLMIFFHKKHKIPEVIDGHFARYLDIKLLYLATSRQQVVDILQRLSDDFVACYQRLLGYKSRAESSQDEKFKRDVGRLEQRFHEITALTVDNIGKLVSGLKKDLALLDKYYAVNLQMFSASIAVPSRMPPPKQQMS